MNPGFNTSVEEVAHHTRLVAGGSQAVGAGDGHILVAVEAGHNPAAVAGRIRTAAEAAHNPADEEGIHLVARSRLGHRTALVEEHHTVLVAGHCSLGLQRHGCFVRLWCHMRSQWHPGEVLTTAPLLV